MHTPSEDSATVEAQFALALLRPRKRPPAQITGPDAQSAKRRYDVYRNNVTIKLIDALAAVFPAVQRITGTDFFRTMARFYVRRNQPRSPLLFEYGQDFPDFIARYQHAQDMPWLADTARIERAWLDSYHATDAQPLEGRHLQNIPPSRLSDLRLVAHPAMRIVRSIHPAYTIFSMNRGEATATAIHDVRAEDTLITRPALEVQVTRLRPGVAEFLLQLATGSSFGAAASEAVLNNPAYFDLPAAVATVISTGAFLSHTRTS